MLDAQRGVCEYTVATTHARVQRPPATPHLASKVDGGEHDRCWVLVKHAPGEKYALHVGHGSGGNLARQVWQCGGANFLGLVLVVGAEQALLVGGEGVLQDDVAG